MPDSSAESIQPGKKCSVCGFEIIALDFEYDPLLIPSSQHPRFVRFYRCGNRMGYAHPSVRIETEQYAQ